MTRTLIIRGRRVCYLGRRYAVLVGTKATLLLSLRDAGWWGAEMIRSNPIVIYKRVDRERVSQ